MEWKTFILIGIGLLGYFGIFWTLNLSNVEIEFIMDNNTLEAIKSISYTYLGDQRDIQNIERINDYKQYYPLNENTLSKNSINIIK